MSSTDYSLFCGLFLLALLNSLKPLLFFLPLQHWFYIENTIQGRLIEPVFTYYFLGLSNEESNEVSTLCLSSSIVQSSHPAILLKLSHFRLTFSAEQLISLFIVVDGAQHLPNVLQRLFQFPSLAHFQRAFSSRLSPHPGSDDTLLVLVYEGQSEYVHVDILVELSSR